VKPLAINRAFAEARRSSEAEFRTLFAGVGTVLVLTVVWVGLYILWPDPATILGFDGQPLAMLGTDAAPQKRAHLIGILVLAVVGAAILFYRSPGAACRTDLLARAVPYVSVFLGLSLALLSLYSVAIAALPATTQLSLYGEVFGTFASPSRTFVVTAIACALLLVPVLAAAKGRPASIFLWSLAIAYSAFLLGAGFVEPILLDRLPPEQVGWVQSHFDAIIGAKRTLAEGLQDRDFGYSLFFNLVQASIERFMGPFSLATDIRILQAGNVAFIIATLWAAYLWNAAKPLIAVFALVLVIPWVHNDSIGLLFPNQAGWRYIAFPLAVIVMRLAHGRRPNAVAFPFGLFAAFAILWNAETGIAVAVALGVRLAAPVERISLPELFRVFVRFVFGILSGIACVLVFYRLGLGRWPDPLVILLDLSARGQGLSRGRPMYFDPLALLVGAFALWFVLRAAAIRRLCPVASRPADRAALGTLILIWGAYFVQQPHPWNLWSYMLPFSLLLGDALFSVRWPRNWKQAAVRLTIPFVVFAFIVAPAVAAGNYQALRSVWHALAVKNASSSEAPLVSGVRLPRQVATSLEQRLNYLPAVPSGTWVFTGDVYLLPKLSDRTDLNIVRSVYWKATLDEFNHLMNQLRSSSPPALIFDDPTASSNEEFVDRYFVQVQKALGGQYHPDRTISGWTIWLRN
jgi:hypothetical protein